MLDQKEVHACVHELFAEEAELEADEINLLIDNHWTQFAGGDSEIDVHELRSMMGEEEPRDGEESTGNVATQIMNHCDKSGNRMLDQPEVHACVVEWFGEPDAT